MIGNTPLVSILMTSYNAEQHIAAAIQSIQEQTYSHWELLLADDCSTDQTRAVIDRFKDPRIRVFHNEKNLHYLRTRNKLIPHVKGELIALLDADDLYTPEKLALQVKEFQKDPDLALCGTFVSYIDKNGTPLPVLDKKPLTYTDIKQAIKKSNVFTGSAIMVRKDIWERIGGYRDFFNTLGYEDYDLTSRIAEKYKSINLSEPLYVYRQYPESTSRRDMLYNPFKLNGHLLIQHFIEERETLGQDSLDRNDIPAIINFMAIANKPYVDDASLVYREMMWGYLHRKMIGLAFKSIFTALRLRPFSFSNNKSFLLLLLISTGIVKE